MTKPKPVQYATYDPDALLLSEVKEAELLSGLTLDKWFIAGMSKADLVRAVVFILTRRDHPEITLDDIDGATLGQTMFTVEVGESGE